MNMLKELLKESKIPSNARSMHEDDFYVWFDNMVKNSNFNSTQTDELLADFNETQKNFKEDEMADRINKVFSKWHFPYKVDKIVYEQGYEPLYIIRKMK